MKQILNDKFKNVLADEVRKLNESKSNNKVIQQNQIPTPSITNITPSIGTDDFLKIKNNIKKE